jgi:hypothetical protein
MRETRPTFSYIRDPLLGRPTRGSRFFQVPSHLHFIREPPVGDPEIFRSTSPFHQRAPYELDPEIFGLSVFFFSITFSRIFTGISQSKGMLYQKRHCIKNHKKHHSAFDDLILSTLKFLEYILCTSHQVSTTLCKFYCTAMIATSHFSILLSWYFIKQSSRLNGYISILFRPSLAQQ